MIKKVMPFVAQGLSSDSRLLVTRTARELLRKVRRGDHELDVFLQISDPYSYLLLQALPELRERYSITINLHGVLDMPDEMYPDVELWKAHAFADAAKLAKLYDFSFPQSQPEHSVAREHAYTARFLELEKTEQALSAALGLFQSFWDGLHPQDYSNEFNRDTFTAKLAANEGLREKLGHYFAGMIYYQGEWYWGIDRLDHLENRLNELGLVREENGERSEPEGSGVRYKKQYASLFCRQRAKVDHEKDLVLEIYFSARSPYSYLGLEHAVKLSRHYGIPLDIKLVLPMVMRGMQVPQAKKMYIFLDTKREAEKHNIPYGKVADPVGPGVERCYALFNFAKSQGKEADYLVAFARAVNSEGVHADTDSGMKSIVRRAGLDWEKAKPFLNNQDWREMTDKHEKELKELGQWGVPCFRYGDTVVWGQDRLWLIEEAICGEK